MPSFLSHCPSGAKCTWRCPRTWEDCRLKMRWANWPRKVNVTYKKRKGQGHTALSYFYHPQVKNSLGLGAPWAQSAHPSLSQQLKKKLNNWNVSLVCLPSDYLSQVNSLSIHYPSMVSGFGKCWDYLPGSGIAQGLFTATCHSVPVFPLIKHIAHGWVCMINTAV